MTEPKVFNKRQVYPTAAIYIGRPSKFGNPFMIGRDGSRAEVIEKYRRFIESNPRLKAAAVKELAGHDLACWCKPHACHGDVLLEIANAPSAAPTEKETP